MRRWAMMAGAVLAAGVRAQTPAPTAQTLYDAAEAAAAKSDWKTAVADYRAARAKMNGGGRAAAVVDARLATSLFYIGDVPGARAAATASVALFGKLGVTADADLAAAHAVLGDAARHDGDDAGAMAAYARAIASAADPAKDRQLDDARAGLALAAMTFDPDAAARALDDAIAASSFAAAPKMRQASLLALRARAQLNRGDAKGAKVFIDRALDLAGRSTTKVNMAQVAMRGDAALIYAKLGNTDAVREILAYSGAGHLADNGWLNRFRGDFPVCGAGVEPQDSAVVEFAVNDEGRPIGAAAVYASKPGPLGDVFAAAVRDWRWPASAVAKLNVFWRSAVRVELRCVTRPPGIGLGDELREATEAWLAAHDARAALDDPTLKPAVPASTTPAGRLLAALLRLRAAEKAADERPAQAELDTALDAAQAPAAVRAWSIGIAQGAAARAEGAKAGDARRAAMMARLEQEPGSARVVTLLRVEAAIGRGAARGNLPEARAALAAVVALPPTTLTADDPIRTVALLHLSLIDKRLGHSDAAEARLVAAGVSADSCSLLDVQPIVKSQAMADNQFPAEAMRWGFEGTVREAFDINADGSVAGVRTVLAYPPLVFGAATERAVRSWRYVIPTLGDKPIGCAAHTVNVRYVLPG